MSNPPKVFISYSWDSESHQDKILKLSNHLRRDGVDCKIDQYEQFPSQGWPRWMEDQIEWADFVLVVCTEIYLRRFRGKEEPGKGLGVTWEGAIVTQVLYDAHVKNTKFIPVLLSSDDERHIPTVLRGFSRYKLDTDNGYIELYRLITDQPEVFKPDLGEIATLESRERTQDFVAEAIVKNPVSPALKIWQEKLAYLQNQEAITADPAQKFALSKQIEECQQKIKELAG
jgi:hypothetical protein